MTRTSCLLALACTGVLACDTEEKPADPNKSAVAPPSQSMPAGDPPKVTPTTDKHMQDHFAKANEIKDAIMRGKLDDAKASAVWMAKHELSENLAEAWRPHVAGMQDGAKRVESAEDLAEAARAGATMARACGDCHKVLGGPKLPAVQKPGDASGGVPHMVKHAWAIDRMWEGLIGPSDPHWVDGSDALADDPLKPAQLAEGVNLPDAYGGRADTVHALGKKANTATDAMARADIMGELLGACAGCHEALKLEIPPA